MRRLGHFATSLLVALGSFGAISPAAFATASTHALGPCTAGPPPYPWHGACGTYNGFNTFYGSHGLGFPSPLGWALCANRAADGGWYPHPSYQYAPGSPPSGAATGQLSALGYAFSEAQRRGWWTAGQSGSFSADEIAVAAKLLYDNAAWLTPLPAVEPGIARAISALQAIMTAAGAISATPVAALALDGGGTTLATTGVLVASLSAPGSNRPLAQMPLTLSLVGATFDATGTSTLAASTDVNGVVRAAFTTTSLAPSTVTASLAVTTGTTGILFYRPTSGFSQAQTLAAPRAPVAQRRTLTLSATGQPTGTVQIVKHGDDEAYLAVTDAVFTILDSANNVVDTLVIAPDGTSDPSQPLPVGTYVVHELTPPIGYDPAPDQTVTVVANATTTVTIAPPTGDLAQRARIELVKRDAETATVLAGAVFSLQFDTSNQLVADGAVETCTTASDGRCRFDSLLPGRYLLREVSPPPHYEANHLEQWVYVGPAETLSVAYVDYPALADIAVRKFSSSTGAAVPGATYDLYVELPGPPTPAPTPPSDAEIFANYRFEQRGVTDQTGHLTFTVRQGYVWCVHEVSAPPGYVLDPGLHCTGSVSTPHAAIELAEVPSLVTITVHKFTVDDPSAGVPHALYALFVKDPFPTGYEPAPAPSNLAVPAGHQLWAIGETNAQGQLAFTVPSGHSWCVQELRAPPGYGLDPALHCTGVVTESTPAEERTIAVAESLAFTGQSRDSWYLAGALLVSGALLLWISRERPDARRRHHFSLR